MLSRHVVLEVAHVVHIGHRPGDPPPLSPGAPVPGCGCPVCLTLAVGGTWDDGRHAEEMVLFMALFPPSERADAVEAARTETEALEYTRVLPSPGVLSLLAARVPGAVREPKVRTRRRSRWDDTPLPIKEARAIPILDIAELLGLHLRRVGNSWRGPCSIHDGDGPNFSIVPKVNGWRCWSCGRSGDGIALMMAVRCVSFAEAVRELAA